MTSNIAPNHSLKAALDEFMDYSEKQLEQCIEEAKPYVNGFPYECKKEAYIDNVAVLCVSLSNLLDLESTDANNTIKNHLFFTHHQGIAAEFVDNVTLPIFVNAHHQLERVERLKTLSKTKEGYVALTESGQSVNILSKGYEIEESDGFSTYSLNGTLGILNSDIQDQRSIEQFNSAYISQT